ncbi:gluzincin family metallopeptidase [Tenacibaculum amylolyticum]|uniref:hypothetical protein n=1 Tax=Tenacibaculum amylolyticum TaxID=104269 RepID=UPI003895BB16
MKFKIITICTLLFFSAIHAQIHIQGSVDIDMNTGVIKCNFDLSNIPKIEDYRILLNKGMNVKYFKNENNELIDYKGHYNAKVKGEGIEYILKDDAPTIPSTFHISYKGAFPIYENEFSAFDYKGIIAFNGETLRATEQTKWYPVIYDVAKDKLINSYTYNVKINVVGGNTIFINGSAPKKGNSTQFVSKKAHPLLLFVGDYDFIENDGNYIINTSVTKENSSKVFKNIEVIKKYLSKNLDLAFTDKVYLINHIALNKRKEGSSWGFNSYPAFAFTNLDFNKMLKENGDLNNRMFKYFGHEFGHNYFGYNVKSGELSWFWIESFAEYLSYTVIEELSGADFLKETLIKQAKSIKDDESFISLDKIKNENEIGNKYRYRVAPLMLKLFEDKFGRKKMSLIIKELLQLSENETLTLDKWKKAAINAGINEKEFNKFMKKFISNKKFEQNIKSEILKNYS